jgi:dihydrofolate synthase/folylpolyglutamate synthase
MNYQEALAYLYHFSDFERGGRFGSNPEESIPRVARLLQELGQPQQRYTNTLIAGTKGKGSTASFVERVLRQAGIRTGLYTQPDLHTFRERIQIEGRLISEEEMVALFPELQAAIEKVEGERQFGPFITYEVATALALLYFARQEIQHAVLEVGLGGRLDATNVTQPLVSVITSISYDHMEVLGNTLTAIAGEKAAIIKPGGVVVTSAQAPEALLRIAEQARKQRARLVRVGSMVVDPAQKEVEAGLVPPLTYRYYLERRLVDRQFFGVQASEGEYRNLEIPLAGAHQLENATAAIATLELLREVSKQGKPQLNWDEKALRDGLSSVRWPARVEVVHQRPLIVVDGAHNADSMQKLQETLHTTFQFKRLLMVFGAASDKDLPGVVEALSESAGVILTQMATKRAATIEQLERIFGEQLPGLPLYSASTTAEALDLALRLADSDDLICATGSLYLAAEALRWAAEHGSVLAASEIQGHDH